MAKGNYEKFIGWVQSNYINYDDIKKTDEIKNIFDFAKNKTGSTDLKRFFDNNAKFRREITTRVEPEVARRNMDYLDNIKKQIKEAATSKGLSSINIDKNYESGTVNSLMSSRNVRQGFLERREEIRDQGLDLSADDIRRSVFVSVDRLAEFYNLEVSEAENVITSQGLEIQNGRIIKTVES